LHEPNSRSQLVITSSRVHEVTSPMERSIMSAMNWSMQLPTEQLQSACCAMRGSCRDNVIKLTSGRVSSSGHAPYSRPISEAAGIAGICRAAGNWRGHRGWSIFSHVLAAPASAASHMHRIQINALVRAPFARRTNSNRLLIYNIWSFLLITPVIVSHGSVYEVPDMTRRTVIRQHYCDYRHYCRRTVTCADVSLHFA